MKDTELDKYLWKGLDLKRYSVVRIVPQDKDNAVVIMYSNDPCDPHWCLQYRGNGHYFDTAKQLMDYYCSRGFKKLHEPIRCPPGEGVGVVKSLRLFYRTTGVGSRVQKRRNQRQKSEKSKIRS